MESHRTARPVRREHGLRRRSRCPGRQLRRTRPPLEFVDTQLIGADRVNGHGVGGDNELGTEIMQSDIQQVLGNLDGRVTSRAEAIFVIAGLGGGTEAAAHPFSFTT